MIFSIYNLYILPFSDKRGHVRRKSEGKCLFRQRGAFRKTFRDGWQDKYWKMAWSFLEHDCLRPALRRNQAPWNIYSGNKSHIIYYVLYIIHVSIKKLILVRPYFNSSDGATNRGWIEHRNNAKQISNIIWMGAFKIVSAYVKLCQPGTFVSNIHELKI